MTNPIQHANTNPTSDPSTGVEAVTVSATPSEYLYFVSWTSMGGFGNCYLPLTFEITTRDDVEWVRDQLREQGVTNAIVLSFALLPGRWGS